MTKESTKRTDTNPAITDNSVEPANSIVKPTNDEIAAVMANKGATETDPRVDHALGIFSDLSALEVSPTEVIAAKEILTCMPVRKPKKNEFVRAQEITFTTFLYQDEDEGEYYFIEPAMRPYFIAGSVVKVLVPAVNQLGSPFIWPVPADDGQSSRNNKWNESHRGAYQQAKTKWTKMVGDRTARQYRVYEATGNLPDPQFCALPFNQQISLAFRGINTIRDPEHPVLRAMRGDIP
jgi:hypothetical protein